MRILILHLDSLAGDAPEKAAAELAGARDVVVHRSTEAALRKLGDRRRHFGLLLLCGDDEQALLAACRTIAGSAGVPPILVLSACNSAETAIALLKAGADDFLFRDPQGAWVARLADKSAAGKRPLDDAAPDGWRLAQIVDGSAVAMFAIDSEHRVTHWNRACAALTGLPASELVGTREQWRAFYRQARPCLADLILDGTVDERLAQYYGSKQARRSAVIADGVEAEDFFPAFGNSGRWLYFTAAPLRDAAGTVIGAVETLQDITEQKRAEEHLRQSEERYRVLSITDGMTGLYNARHFSQRLREEMDRCERYGHSLSLMVLDVDNFKTFNDTWGHVQGDQALIQLAECITACLRRTDQAFRYGGEEFVALLPETNLDEAEAAAERIRLLFERSDITTAPGQRVECTASIGVTAFVPGESPRDFVARADSGTYEAKRQGKNRVIRILPPNTQTA